MPQAQNEELKQSNNVRPLLIEDLSLDSVGNQVAILQSMLRLDPSLYSGSINGFFGVSTKDAVSRFQKKYLLPQTGEMDLPSRLKFNEIYARSNSVVDGLSEKWGVAEKVAGTQYGWSMKIENDFSMGTAQEIFFALNTYRLKKGVASLNWNESLENFAKERAQSLSSRGGVDDHKGFKEYVRNPDNRNRLGFSRLGENSSCGYRMTGAHMIEWIFAGDSPHDDNQLSNKWTHIGVSVSKTCVSLIFGYNRR